MFGLLNSTAWSVDFGWLEDRSHSFKPGHFCVQFIDNNLNVNPTTQAHPSVCTLNLWEVLELGNEENKSQQ